MVDELLLLGACEQARLIEKRAISPVELVQGALTRIERYDGRLRAYITVCAQDALAQARAAEAEIAAGRYRGPLHGLPFGVKDQLHAAGVRTTLGSRATGPGLQGEEACCIAR